MAIYNQILLTENKTPCRGDAPARETTARGFVIGGNEMAVFRVHKSENYTVLSNYHFKEKGMSLKAKGLLSLMLSLPDTWDYSAAGLVKLSKDGKDSVNAALKELEQFGYLKRSQAFNENGTFGGYDYEIFEKPNADAKTEKPSTRKPKSVKPFAEKPSTENPPQLSKKKSNKKELNTVLIKDEEERKKENVRTTYDGIINGKIFDDKVKAALYEFIKMRQMIKKPLTNFALDKIIDKLYSFTYDTALQVEILEYSVVNNYPDIYNPKKGAKKPKAKTEASDNVTQLFSDEIDEDDKLQYFTDVVRLTDNQVGKLLDIMGLKMFDLYVDKLAHFIKNTGDVKNHYATILKWYKEDTAVAQ